MTTMFAARLSCVLAVLASVFLALPPTQAAAQAQRAPVQGAPLRPAVEMARVVDDGTNLLVLPIVRLGTTVCAAPIWRLSTPAPARCLRRSNEWNALRNSPATSRRQRCHRARTSAGGQHMYRCVRIRFV
jgi:hypothetical protein